MFDTLYNMESFHHQVSKALSAAAVIAWLVYGLGILCGILLVVAASKRSATMLVVMIVFNGIGIGGLSYIFICNPNVLNFALIGLTIWALLMAIGGRQDVKSEANIA